MSAIFMRFGLYGILLVVAAFAIRDFVETFPLADLANDVLLMRLGIVSVVLLALGIIARPFEKVKAKVTQARCVVCRKPVIVAGQQYCREHLKEFVNEEQERMRQTARPR